MYALNGTESKKQISGTTTIKDGIISGGSSYLTDFIIDNNKDWEIILDASFSGAGSAFVIVKQGTTSRDKNHIMYAWQNNTSNIYSSMLMRQDGYSGLGNHLSQRVPTSTNTYAHFIIKKQGYEYSIVVDDEYYLNIESSTFATICPALCIGVDTWGGTTKLKNIKIKYL